MGRGEEFLNAFSEMMKGADPIGGTQEMIPYSYTTVEEDAISESM